MSDKPPRRDPRRERRGRKVSEQEGPDGAEAGDGRRRREPATGSAGGGDRRRRDPRAERGRRGAREEAPGAADSGPLVVSDPPGWVLAVPELADGRLGDHDRDVLGGARTLADAAGGGVAAVVFGTAEADLGAAGADRVVAVPGPAAAYDPEAQAEAVARVLADLEPWHAVFPDTVPGTGDVARRVAARAGEGVASNVRRLAAERLICRGDGERSEYYLRPPRFVLVAAEGAEPYAGPRREARVLEGPAPDPGTDLVDEGPIPVDPKAIPLAEADFIAAAGNGVTDWDAFHRLSAALGAAEGATRVVCDARLLPRERQVGISGTLVGARCYLALGISGAPQHLQGIEDCDRVIAVNADPHAPIMKRADLAVVGDVQAVMAALLERLDPEPEEAAHARAS